MDAPAMPARGALDSRHRWGREYAASIAAVALATVICWYAQPLFIHADAALVYILTVLVVSTRVARGPAIACATASVLSFDFYFVEPIFGFHPIDGRFFVTLFVMLAVGLITSSLTVALRERTEAARDRERLTAVLYSMTRELLGETGRDRLAGIAERHIGQALGAEVTVLLGRTDAGDREGGMKFLPLVAGGRTLGVIGIGPSRIEATLPHDYRTVLETLVAQTALALERAHLAEEGTEARIAAETERTRSALLSSVSHDLRTPLASISGAADVLIEGAGASLSPENRLLLESVRGEAGRLSSLVNNLLELTRLESGSFHVRKEWCPVEEVVGAAIRNAEPSLRGRRLKVVLPDSLLLVHGDPVLLDLVLVNLLENAARYGPPDAPLEVRCGGESRRVVLEVVDGGPGIPAGDEKRIFEPFYRAPGAPPGGAGLGLSLCQAVVRVHGGTIEASNGPRGGAVLRIVLPSGEAVPPREIAE
jgi:two-component system sensor histidine kinase KdpD